MGTITETPSTSEFLVSRGQWDRGKIGQGSADPGACAEVASIGSARPELPESAGCRCPF